MATETRDILLKLKLEGDSDLKKRNNDLLLSFQKNKTEIEANNKALKDLKAAGDTTSQAVVDLTLKNIELKNSNKAIGTELNNNIKIIGNEIGALNEKRAILSNMNAAYAKLSEEQKKNTAEGIAQGAAIRKLSDEIGNEEKALGNATRDVGKYTDGIIAANAQMGFSNTIIGKVIVGYKAFKVAALEASGGTSVLNGAMKLLSTNPIFAIIAIVVGVFMLLKEALGRNQEAVDKFTRGLAPLKLILGIVFGILGDFVELLAGGFEKAMSAVASLFGDAGKAAKEYADQLRAADDAADELINLQIRQKLEQRELNNLMAVANNRSVEGVTRKKAMMEAIKMETDLAEEQAQKAKIIFEAAIANISQESGLYGKMVNEKLELTADANRKLSDENKEAYLAALDEYLGYKNKESEIAKAAGMRLGTINNSVITEEKAKRDTVISLMQDGISKQVALIQSASTAELDIIKNNAEVQRANLNANLQINLEAVKGNYAEMARLSLQFNRDINEVNKYADEQDLIIKQSRDNKIRNAQRLEAKSVLDATTGLQRQLQDSILNLMEDGYEKESMARLQAHQRQVEDLKRNAEFTGKNKKEVNELVLALDQEYYQKKKELDEANIKAIEDTIFGDIIAAKTRQINLQLDIAKKGTEEEKNLRIAALKVELEEELANTEINEKEKQLLRERYAKESAELELFYTKQAQQKVLDEIRLGAENQVETARQAGEDYLSIKLSQKEEELATIAQMEDESDQEFIARKLALKDELVKIQQEQTNEMNRIRESEFKFAQAIANGFDNLSDLLKDTGEEGAEWAKALALFSILLNTAVSISQAVASAKGLTAFDYAAQIAVAVGAALAGIVQAKAIFKTAKVPGKAMGGIIEGPGSGTSDSVPINASANESILTANSTGMFAPLLSGLNLAGGGVAIQSVNKSAEVMGEEFLANAFKKALGSMPPPVLDLQEFHIADNRLTSIEQSARR